MAQNKHKECNEDYEVEEIELSYKEIKDLIEKLQNLDFDEHIHLKINKNKEIMIHKRWKKRDKK